MFFVVKKLVSGIVYESGWHLSGGNQLLEAAILTRSKKGNIVCCLLE